MNNTTKAFIALACGLLALSACGGRKKTANVSEYAGPIETYQTTPSNAALISEFEKSGDNHVLFAFDSSKLDSQAKSTAKKQAEWLGRHTQFNGTTVEGHCDRHGTREYNLALGERRAESLKQELISDGVDGNRLNTVSYGKERPAVIGDTKEADRQNRRAVVVPGTR